VDNAVDKEFERTAQADEFWADVRIQPLLIALPSGSGYTLRAYRTSDEVPEALPDDAENTTEVDAEELVTKVEGEQHHPAQIVRHEDRAETVLEEHDLEVAGEPSPPEFADEDEEKKPAPIAEEVPIFLARRGKLLLFRSVEGLAAFVDSGLPHDMSKLEEWDRVSSKLNVSHIVPSRGDTYELDLVVENLRGGHDAWDPGLIISAGEVARDLGYALRLETVQAALAPGSPLDDLDEALRKFANGGVGGYLARRRVRKIGIEQAALAWRTIVGKISATTDWRD
jgi:hypothetical protein